MSTITIIGAYYNQPQMLAESWENFRAYEDEVRERTKIILCDDGSKAHPLKVPADIKKTFDVKAFRLLGDQPWREMACRNLCMHHAEGWCFMTDPDYLLKPQEMKKLQHKTLERGRYYHLNSRLVTDGSTLRRPENMSVLHTEDFWNAGGYDEQFAGAYGFSDALFFKCLRDGLRLRDTLVEDIFMDHYPMGRCQSEYGNKVITDAASSASKDTKRNNKLFADCGRFMRLNGVPMYIKHSKSRTLRFKWEQTC